MDLMEHVYDKSGLRLLGNIYKALDPSQISNQGLIKKRGLKHNMKTMKVGNFLKTCYFFSIFSLWCELSPHGLKIKS